MTVHRWNGSVEVEGMRTGYRLDVVDELLEVRDHLDLLRPGDFTRKHHEHVGIRKAKQASLVTGILLGCARDLPSFSVRCFRRNGRVYLHGRGFILE